MSTRGSAARECICQLSQYEKSEVYGCEETTQGFYEVLHETELAMVHALSEFYLAVSLCLSL